MAHNSFTPGYWWPLMDPATTRVFLLKRNLQQIYNSFLQLKWRQSNARERHETYERIETHWRAAEAASARYRIPHILVHYAEFAKDTEGTARRIRVFFDLRLAGRFAV